MPIVLFTIVVRDYDEAIAFYTRALGFTLLEDTNLGPGSDGRPKRWVRVAPPGGRGCAVLLARAATPEQEAAIGKAAGGRVCAFLETEDFQRDYAAFRSRGVVFLGPPRDEPYGVVAVFQDLYGNKWDLIQPRAAPATRRTPG